MKKQNRLNKIRRARELRKEQTEAEEILWKYLRDRGFFGKKFRRQHIIRGFILDFYCPERKIAIELDGSIHLKQKDYDLARQTLIESYGLHFLRFNNLDIQNNIKKVLLTIKNKINPSPSSMEKGVKHLPMVNTNRDEDL